MPSSVFVREVGSELLPRCVVEVGIEKGGFVEEKAGLKGANPQVRGGESGQSNACQGELKRSSTGEIAWWVRVPAVQVWELRFGSPVFIEKGVAVSPLLGAEAGTQGSLGLADHQPNKTQNETIQELQTQPETVSKK